MPEEQSTGSVMGDPLNNQHSLKTGQTRVEQSTGKMMTVGLFTLISQIMRRMQLTMLMSLKTLHTSYTITIIQMRTFTTGNIIMQTQLIILPQDISW